MLKFKLMRQTLLALGAALIVAACGGGGGGGAAEPTRAFTITITIADNTLLSNLNDFVAEPGTDFATTITVRVTQTNGNVVPDGTTVSLSVNDGTLGAFSTTDDLATQTATISAATVGGAITVVFHTLEATGTAVITASAFDPNANQTVTQTSNIQVAEGPPMIERLTLEAQSATIPANSFGVGPFIGSPFSTEVTISFRDAEGVLVAPAMGMVGVSVDPVTIAAFATLDDPATMEVDESMVLIGNGPVDLAAGTGSIFVHAFGTPGTAVVRVTAQDAATAENFSVEIPIEVVEPAGDGRPANVTINAPATPLYIQNSGGNTANQFDIQVIDGGSNAVANPTGGANNVLLELFTESPDTGEELSALNGSGANVSGRSIAIATTNGFTSANLRSGNEPTLARVRATADASDNNVDNGVQIPVLSEATFVISDGIPFSVTLTTFPVNSLIVNPISTLTMLVDPDPDDPFPAAPNATYSLRVNAIVTDRRGNPPAVPVALDFGVIDAPLDGFPGAGPGTFAISGTDGNPQEGGVGFNAPFGEFTTAGGGAGPGDTVILFGKDVVGNADLESARTVTQVINQTNLNVDEAFNFNDTTGVSVNDGPVIPYIVGRATTGNINTAATTDAMGVASTTLNYPVSRVGQLASIYVQGTNGNLGGASDIRTFADAELIRYPALAPVMLTASPSTIAANTAVPITVCLTDAAGVGIIGQSIGFAFQASSGVNTVDGIPNAGTVAQPTGFDGCTVANVETSGALVGSDMFTLQFIALGVTADVTIEPPGAAVILLNPSTLTLPNSIITSTILVTYVDGSGAPEPNIQIVVMCDVMDGEAGVFGTIEPTDANGETVVRIRARLDDGTFGTNVGSGTCTFTTATGDPTAQLTLDGFDVCANVQNISPPLPPGACPDPMIQRTFAIQFQRAPGNPLAGMVTEVQATSVPGDLNCAFDLSTNTQSGSCSSSMIDDGTNVNVIFSPGVTAATAAFSGDCIGQTATTATADVNSDSVCLITVDAPMP